MDTPAGPFRYTYSHEQHHFADSRIADPRVSIYRPRLNSLHLTVHAEPQTLLIAIDQQIIAEVNKTMVASPTSFSVTNMELYGQVQHAVGLDPAGIASSSSSALTIGVLARSRQSSSVDVAFSSADSSEPYKSGCLDSWATNFDDEAWYDDGSCEYDRLYNGDLRDRLASGALLERWHGMSLKSVRKRAASPDISAVLHAFDSHGMVEPSVSARFTQRIRSLFAPAMSGTHTFRLRAQGPSQLLISGGHREVGATPLASTGEAGSNEEWSELLKLTQDTEAVGLVKLHAGEMYYLETLQDGVESDRSQIQLGVTQPDGISFCPIPASGQMVPDELSINVPMCPGLSAGTNLSLSAHFIDGMPSWETSPDAHTQAEIYFAPESILVQDGASCEN
eukprot:COSAG02_NODE_14448_length_1271_cov_0.741468_1_plen_392_part_10